MIMNVTMEDALEALFQLVFHNQGRIATLETEIAGRETCGAFSRDSDLIKKSAKAYTDALTYNANTAVCALADHHQSQRGKQS